MVLQLKTTRRTLAMVAAFFFLSLQIMSVFPQEALASAQDDLKNIEYKYYFRGDYERAIAELTSFLERTDLEPPVIVEAREYLAASHVFSGAGDAGKAQFLEILKLDPAYAGPDPSVFKSIVIATYDSAKSEYASMIIRSVPETAPVSVATTDAVSETSSGKPIYKKWWFYAGVGAAFLILAGASSKEESSGGSANDTGRVVVEVGLQ